MEQWDGGRSIGEESRRPRLNGNARAFNGAGTSQETEVREWMKQHWGHDTIQKSEYKMAEVSH